MERDLDLDYSERAGFMVGKSAAIADWRFHKEEGDFKKLCHRLYMRNWAKARRRLFPELVKAYQKAWRDRNREKIRKADRDRRAAKRQPKFIVCWVCGTKKQVRAIVTTPGRETKFCSRKCRNSYHDVPRARARSLGIRNMVIVPQILDALTREPGLRLRAIHARLEGAKYQSLATTLCKLARQGKVTRRGRLYYLAADANEGAAA